MKLVISRIKIQTQVTLRPLETMPPIVLVIKVPEELIIKFCFTVKQSLYSVTWYIHHYCFVLHVLLELSQSIES